MIILADLFAALSPRRRSPAATSRRKMRSALHPSRRPSSGPRSPPPPAIGASLSRVAAAPLPAVLSFLRTRRSPSVMTLTARIAVVIVLALAGSGLSYVLLMHHHGEQATESMCGGP